MIPATSGIGAASVLKAVPILGTIVGGFVMPVLSAGATYAIGKAFIQHFASGGTLLDFNPPDYREFIKAQKEMWDSRVKDAAPRRSASAESATRLLTRTGVCRPIGSGIHREARAAVDRRDRPHARSHRLYRVLRSSRDFAASTAAWAFSAHFFSRLSPLRWWCCLCCCSPARRAASNGVAGRRSNCLYRVGERISR